MFPQRNRIIAGLCSVVTVIEAGRDSGALITATLAAEQGREVYAVPGNITSMWSLGTNKLIADGAMPVVTVDDVSRAMGLDVQHSEEEYRGLSELEKKVVMLVKSAGEVTLEFLCTKTGMNPVDMNGIIMVLEMKGYLATNFGKIFVAKF
jgi:DNA processing protein